MKSGFDLLAVVAEYRALRAGVIRLWRESDPDPDLRDLADVTRFNEAIDQSLTEAVRSFTERVERSRQMFLAILGHDLRNPLHSITMSADILSDADQLDAELAGIASGISTSALAMGRMIGDLTGEWDAARLRQVVSNLLGNAVQHGADTGPVDCAVTADGPEVVFAVRNSGPPIPPAVLPTIFDPLARGGPSPESKKPRRPGSLGLGLHVAREVVAAHGGSIDVESSAAAGTVFTVRLPRRRAAR